LLAFAKPASQPIIITITAFLLL